MNQLTRKFALIALGTALAASAFNQDQAPATLKVGDPAPALKIKHWMKGTPVTALGNGKVNVVEFWATWCGPCKVSIPHLTELAHKYKGQATFTGVSVWEDPDAKDEKFLGKVDSFVKEMGPQMDYNVAADGLAPVMAKTWMAAAGQSGIPTAFVIDQKGRVAWIGHPMDGLDEAVGQVIKGTFDIQAQAAKQNAKIEQEAKEQAETEELQRAGKPVEDAIKAKKFDVAADEIGKLIPKYPAMADKLAMAKYTFLLRADELKGFAYAKELANGQLKGKGEMLNAIAWDMVADDSKFKHKDYATAVLIARRAAEAGQMKDPFSLDTYAYALFKVGEPKEALDIETSAIKYANSAGAQFPPDALKEMKDRFAKIKAKAAK